MSNDSLGRFIKKHIENEKRADMIECHCSDIAEVSLSNENPCYSFKLRITCICTLEFIPIFQANIQR